MADQSMLGQFSASLTTASLRDILVALQDSVVGLNGVKTGVTSVNDSLITLTNALTAGSTGSAGSFFTYKASGADDTAGINNALASLPSQGGTLFLTSSLYQVSGAISLGSGQKIFGMGFGGTKVKATGGQTNLFNLGVAQSAEIRDILITGSCTNAISMTGAGECLIQRVDIESVVDGTITNGITLVNGAGITYYTRIYDCKINQCSNSAIYGTGSSIATFIDIVNVNIGCNGVGSYGIHTTNVGLQLTNTSILQAVSDGVVATSTTTPSQGFSAIGSVFDSCGGSGVNLTNYGSVLIADSWVSANGHYGVSITTSTNVKITGNRTHYNGFDGIYCTGITNSEIVDNHVVNNNTSNGSYNGITLTGTSSQIVISGNLSRNGATGPTGHQKYGLYIDSAVSDVMVSMGNSWDNNVTGNYFIHASATNISLKNYSSSVSSGSSVSLSSGVQTNITSITIPAGSWMIWGVVVFAGASTTSVASLIAGTSTTSATLPSPGDTNRNDIPGNTGTIFANFATQVSVPFGPYFVTTTGSTTYYLIADASFSVSTCNGYGTIYARRVQ